METGLINNAFNQNLDRLTSISTVAHRTVDFLLNQAGEGVLKEVKTKEQLDDLNRMITDVLVAKLRKKFNV